MTIPAPNFAGGASLTERNAPPRRYDAVDHWMSDLLGDRVALQPASVLGVEPEHLLIGRRRVRAGQPTSK